MSKGQRGTEQDSGLEPDPTTGRQELLNGTASALECVFVPSVSVDTTLKLIPSGVLVLTERRTLETIVSGIIPANISRPCALKAGC
jgi:hypothetical protein